MSSDGHAFPLAALVGQEQLKTALLLCAVNPGMGGLLIRGDKGSAKSTAARGLAGVMAPIERAVGCVYNCAPDQPAACCEVCNGARCSFETIPVPFVNLPLGAGEDRVLGSLDFERALKEGRKAFQPGLLAAAHRGILYIDEVNLLPDHLVDVLLDVAAMGVNRVQREGLSIQHPARIALLGTMNQEEGELRPQLLDRFGLMVEVRAPLEPGVRTEIVRRRLAWEADPASFGERWRHEQTALCQQVLRAQALLPEVVLADGLLSMISELCCSQGVTSLRADLVMNKAARARAALDGRNRVRPEDLSEVALLVLPHRRRTKPFERPGVDEAALQRFIQRAAASGAASGSADSSGDGSDGAGAAGELHRGDGTNGVGSGGLQGAGVGSRNGGTCQGEGLGDPAYAAPGTESGPSNTSGGSAPGRRTRGADGGDGERSDNSSGEPRGEVFAAGEVGAPPRIQVRSGAVAMSVLGRRSVSPESRRGREVRAVPAPRPSELAVTATLHHSVLRAGGLSADGRPEVTRADLHQKVRSGRQGNLILFVVDASGSMAALRRMQMVKGTVLALLRDAYQRRDEVGVIAFRGASAELLLPPTRSVETAEHQLRELPTGGRTPLAHALRLADEVLTTASGPSRPQPLVVVLSDGRANVPLDDGAGDPWDESLRCATVLSRKGIPALVLDTEVGYVRMGRARELAEALGARSLSLEEFGAESLSLTIRRLS
jgi:magnesium chelatase subunit D